MCGGEAAGLKSAAERLRASSLPITSVTPSLSRASSGSTKSPVSDKAAQNQNMSPFEHPAPMKVNFEGLASFTPAAPEQLEAAPKQPGTAQLPQPIRKKRVTKAKLASRPPQLRVESAEAETPPGLIKDWRFGVGDVTPATPMTPMTPMTMTPISPLTPLTPATSMASPCSPQTDLWQAAMAYSGLAQVAMAQAMAASVPGLPAPPPGLAPGASASPANFPGSARGGYLGLHQYQVQAQAQAMLMAATTAQVQQQAGPLPASATSSPVSSLFEAPRAQAQLKVGARKDAFVKCGGEIDINGVSVLAAQKSPQKDTRRQSFAKLSAAVQSKKAAQDRSSTAGSAVAEVLAMATDSEGHKLVLEMFERARNSVGEARALIEQLQGSVLRFSADRFGCRVVQKALEMAPRDLQVRLAMELKGHIVDQVQHMHGNFVIQKCIEQLPQDMITFIVEEMEHHAEHLASHMYGCRAVQRLFEQCSSRQLDGLMSRVLTGVESLAQDSYGNNVLRHLLEHGGAREQRHIIKVLVGCNLVQLAKNKSSSLVLEKCMHAASQGAHANQLQKERAALVAAVLRTDGPEGPVLEQIMLDKFGNYIVQRTIECSQGEERKQVRKRLWAVESQLRSSACGKHILASMRREFGNQRRGAETCTE